MKELTDQSTNLFGKKERTGMSGLVPDLSPDEEQINLATKLAKGKIVYECLTISKITGQDTITGACPLLTLTEGCSKPLIMLEEGVGCENGVSKISSMNINELPRTVDIPLVT